MPSHTRTERLRRVHELARQGIVRVQKGGHSQDVDVTGMSGREIAQLIPIATPESPLAPNISRGEREFRIARSSGLVKGMQERKRLNRSGSFRSPSTKRDR